MAASRSSAVEWRRCLGLLQEGDALAEHRRSYARTRQELLHDPRGDEGDLATNNPLCSNPDSSWARFFQNEELSRTVGLDLERLNPGDAFCASAPVQRALRSLLMVWSLRNPRLSYRQGMHELASTLFAALFRDACGAGADAEQLVVDSHDGSVDARADACDARYLEHDCYALFCALLAPGGEGPGTEGPGLGLQLYYEEAQAAAPGRPARPAPVQAALQRIWATLAAVDGQLHAHLAGCGVQPQLFMLRWLRLLFGREYHADDVAALWGCVIAAAAEGQAASPPRPPGELVEAVACAMLLFLRPSLMSAPDFSALLRRLQKFPPVTDIGPIWDSALSLLPAVQAVARLPRAGGEPPPPPPASPAGGLLDAARGAGARRASAPPPLQPSAALAQAPAPGSPATSTPRASAFPTTSFAPGDASLLPLAAAATRAGSAAADAARAVREQVEGEAARAVAAAMRVPADLGAALESTRKALGGSAAAAAAAPASPTRGSSAAAVAEHLSSPIAELDSLLQRLRAAEASVLVAPVAFGEATTTVLAKSLQALRAAQAALRVQAEAEHHGGAV